MARRKRILQDSKKRQTIASVLSIGCSLQAAARMVGCSVSTIRREGQLDPAFAVQLDEAKGKAEVSYMQRINKAAEKDQYWRAAAWVLERRHPEHYAARSPDVITFAQLVELIGKIAEIIEKEIPVARYRQRVRKRLDALALNTRRKTARQGARRSKQENSNGRI